MLDSWAPITKSFRNSNKNASSESRTVLVRDGFVFQRSGPYPGRAGSFANTELVGVVAAIFPEPCVCRSQSLRDRIKGIG